MIAQKSSMSRSSKCITIGYLKNKKDEESTESTSGVPAKNPPKVKSVIEESLRAQGFKRWEKFHVP